MRDGYNPKFLHGTEDSFHIELPKPSLNIQSDILLPEGAVDGEFEVKYIHYSLLMSKSNRQALVSAANVDNANQQTVSGSKGRRWFVDARVGRANQIGNASYKHSPWDRGHLTRRTAVTWGSFATALKASNDSCAYTNAAMQHENFNEDEWRVPEELVDDFDLAKDKKLTVMTGPVFTTCDRFFTRNLGDAPVRIPAGFWKILSYINKNTGELSTDAYILFQDIEAIRSSRGRQRVQLGNFAVTTTEVALWTGLEFDQKLYDSNGMMFAGDDGMGAEILSASRMKALLPAGQAATLSAGIADEEAIQNARETMSLEDFYSLIEAVSWV
ncbi:MAG: DNA/RNA non-specific endonuclease [Kordiimonadaceae bacterium]|nr:DNA/RNA non-specific endonuclease [Kordiimonadaceae bacterium]